MCNYVCFGDPGTGLPCATDKGRAMRIVDETTDHGVTERTFTRDVDGDTVPGVLWLPAGDDRPRPIVLVGHGGLQHKKVPNIVELAAQLVRNQGYGVVALDAPGH